MQGSLARHLTPLVRPADRHAAGERVAAAAAAAELHVDKAVPGGVAVAARAVSGERGGEPHQGGQGGGEHRVRGRPGGGVMLGNVLEYLFDRRRLRVWRVSGAAGWVAQAAAQVITGFQCFNCYPGPGTAPGKHCAAGSYIDGQFG